MGGTTTLHLILVATPQELHCASVFAHLLVDDFENHLRCRLLQRLPVVGTKLGVDVRLDRHAELVDLAAAEALVERFDIKPFPDFSAK